MSEHDIACVVRMICIHSFGSTNEAWRTVVLVLPRVASGAAQGQHLITLKLQITVNCALCELPEVEQNQLLGSVPEDKVVQLQIIARQALLLQCMHNLLHLLPDSFTSQILR